ncbi:MAG: replication-relaxation family protein [Polyangiales bacterium]
MALRAVAAARFANRLSLIAYAGPSGLVPDLIDTWVAAGLLFAGVVRLDPLTSTDTHFVSLTSLGARELSIVTGQAVPGISAARLRRSGRKLAHDVLVGEVVLAALTLGRDAGIDLVGVEADDTKLTSVGVVPGPPPVRVPLRADALVMIRGERGPSALLVEVDRGTISRDRMQDKYAGYLAWHEAHGPERDWNLRALRVLTLVPSASRLSALHDAALAANRGRRSGLLLFALQRDVAAFDPDRMLEPIARSLGNDAHVPLFQSRRPT